MDPLSQKTNIATQATQEYYDPRRGDSHESSYDPLDEADTILLLHPASPRAYETVRRTAFHTPRHVRRYEEPGNLAYEPFRTHQPRRDEEMVKDRMVTQHGNIATIEGAEPFDNSQVTSSDNSLALRFSSKIRDIKMGFTFGRSEQDCDIIIKPHNVPYKVSKVHFRIYVTEGGVPMIMDCSTNGTLLDEKVLHSSSGHVLSQGSKIEVITWSDGETKRTEKAIFIVSIPLRDNPDVLQQHNRIFNDYQRLRANAGLAFRGADAIVNVGNGRDFNHGMQWNGAPKYSVMSRIGGGAFAAVYLLTTRSHGELYAAKEIPKKQLQKIEGEITIMKRASTHPHVVELYEYHESPHHLYLIMEYMSHGDLGKFTVKGNFLGEADTQQVAKQVCHALEYIHSVGITHRDVKPDNILIKQKQPLWVTLSDFGLSKLMEEGGTAGMNTFCGTILYCAPEVFPAHTDYRKRDPKMNRYTSKVDIWSLGCVLYQLMLEQPPHNSPAGAWGEALQMNFFNSLINTEVNYELAKGRISSAAISFLQKCLQVDPERRPTARDCLQLDWLVPVKDVVEVPPIAEAIHIKETYSEVLSSQAFSDSDFDLSAAEAFLNYREHSTTPGTEMPVMKTLAERQKLFGEVGPSGLPDSGIFPANERPIVRNGEEAPAAVLTKDPDVQIETEPDGYNSTLSYVQELTISSPDASTLMPPPPRRALSQPITHPSFLKRQREDERADLVASFKRPAHNGLPKSSSAATMFGRLIPVEGSIQEAEELELHTPISAWGRHPSLTHQWPRLDDRRIPKTGMDVMFWAQELIDDVDRAGLDWLNFLPRLDAPLIRGELMDLAECYVKTRSTLGIRVNGILLERSDDTNNPVWRAIRLRTGDVIEIFDGSGGFLRYQCEFYVGFARARRPLGSKTLVEECRDLQAWSEKMSEQQLQETVGLPN